MYSDGSTRALPRVGFPIRRSRGQRSVSTSPGLIAAAHVLHRLSAPRHPPCALVLLIEKNTFDVYCYGVFKVHGLAPTTRASRPEGRSLKTQQRTSYMRRGRRRFQASRLSPTAEAIKETDAYRSNCSGIP